MCHLGNLWLAMSAILLSWFVAIPATIGIGLYAGSLLKWRKLDLVRFQAAWFLGIACIFLFGMVLNFWYPLRHGWVFILVLGWIGLLSRGRSLMRWFVAFCRHRRRLLATILLFAIWLSNRCIGPSAGDTNLYHWNMIRWGVEYPLVPGLAHFHERFGTNSGHWVLASILDGSPWRGRSNHVFMGYIILTSVALALASLLNRKQNRSVADIFRAFTVFPMCGLALDKPGICGFYAEPVLLVATLAAGGFLLDVTGFPGSRKNEVSVAMVLLLVSMMVAIKLSGAFLAAGLIVVLSAMLWRGGSRGLCTRQLVVICILSGGIVLAWMGRGIVISGYPLFPSGFMGGWGDWSLNRRVLDDYRDVVKVYAQWANLPLNPDAWFFPWIMRHIKHPSLLLFALAAGFAASVLAVKRPCRHRNRRPLAILLPFAAMGSFVPWFITAPDLRFVEHGVWILFCSGMALWAFVLSQSGRRALWVTTTVAAVLLMLIRPIAGESRYAKISISQSAKRWLWHSPGPDIGLFPPSENERTLIDPMVDSGICSTVPFINRNGVLMYVPERNLSILEPKLGSNGNTSMVWAAMVVNCPAGDSPLPLAYIPRPDVEYRNGRSCQQGFRIRH